MPQTNSKISMTQHEEAWYQLSKFPGSTSGQIIKKINLWKRNLIFMKNNSPYLYLNLYDLLWLYKFYFTHECDCTISHIFDLAHYNKLEISISVPTHAITSIF